MPLYPTQQPQTVLQTPGTPEGKRQRGTGFTNIATLLGANVGAGQTMGSAIGGSIGQKAGQLKTDVTAAGQKFQQQYQQEKEKTLGGEGTIGGVSDYLTGKKNISDLTPEQAEEIGKKMREAGYGGLNELENQKALMSRAGNISALGTLAGMGSIGQGRLLQGIGARRGGYSRGQGLLDQFLVGQDVGAQQAIRQGATGAFGAAQQAQTEANVAREQAEGLKKSIEAQKAETQQGVLKSLAGAQEQATQSAKNYLAQADRIKKLLLKEIPEDQRTIEDELLMSDLKKYGLDEASIYGEDEGNIDALINAIASSTPVVYSGQQKYGSQAEQKAAENLALLSGQRDVAKKIADTKFDERLFEGANKEIQNLAKQSQEKTENELKNLGLSNEQDAIKTENELKKLIKRSPNEIYGEGNIDIDSPNLSEEIQFNQGVFEERNPYQYWNNVPLMRYALKYLGDGEVRNIMAQAKKDATEGPFWNKKVNAARAANNARAMIKNKLIPITNRISALNARYQSRTTLQDYINKKFNIPSPQANPQEVENE